ncbi:MAG: 16S rRNA (guanine(527)-N(7))-methyltransferase RsmG [candidate division WOR-3 bacterium]|nr:MAG: 16S rRNA (guanine(527)-N(7))-methyltransferase RsmG [candidate division WOR-3 bacterium]
MASRGKNNVRVDAEREIDDIKAGLKELGIDTAGQTIEKFRTYLDALYSYRDRMHLLSRRDYERIGRRHFLTSLIAHPYVKDSRRICDVGAGAGFPSLPLKILFPEVHFVLFESNRKKAEFLDHLVDMLGLHRIEVINARAEGYSGHGFDLVLLRAVGKVDRLLKVVQRLLVRGGRAIFFKTQDVEAELRRASTAISKMGYGVEVRKIQTPVEKIPMALVILRKP